MIVYCFSCDGLQAVGHRAPVLPDHHDADGDGEAVRVHDLPQVRAHLCQPARGDIDQGCRRDGGDGVQGGRLYYPPGRGRRHILHYQPGQGKLFISSNILRIVYSMYIIFFIYTRSGILNSFTRFLTLNFFGGGGELSHTT